MLQYVQQNKKCRNTVLLRYFGETTNAPCGICDVYLERIQIPAQSLTQNILKRENGKISDRTHCYANKIPVNILRAGTI